VKEGMEIIPVSRMEQVLQHALTRQPVPIVWEEDLTALRPKAAEDDAAGGLVAH